MPSTLEKQKFLQESSVAPKPKSEGFPSNLQARAQPCRDGAEGSTFLVSPRPLGAVRLQDFTQCLAIPAHSLLQNTCPLSALPEGPRLGPGRAGIHTPSSQKVPVSVGYAEPFTPCSRCQGCKCHVGCMELCQGRSPVKERH